MRTVRPPTPILAAMIWDNVDNSIIQVDDGGIFKLQAPMITLWIRQRRWESMSPAIATWKSLNGELRVTEATTVAYDSLNNVVFAGTQDNGTVQQTVASPSDGMPDTNGRWETVHVGDGVKVDGGRAKQVASYSVSMTFMRYFQNNISILLSTREYDETNNVDSSKDVPLTAQQSDSPFRTSRDRHPRIRRRVPEFHSKRQRTLANCC